MLNRDNIENLLNKSGNVIGTDGEKIGSIGQLYADDDTGEPTWVTVKTGLFGTSQSFVPVEGARTQDDDLVVPYTKEHVKDAPHPPQLFGSAFAPLVFVSQPLISFWLSQSL